MPSKYVVDDTAALPPTSYEAESNAMRAIHNALAPLSDEARARVIRYAMDYFRVGFGPGMR